MMDEKAKGARHRLGTTVPGCRAADRAIKIVKTTLVAMAAEEAQAGPSKEGKPDAA